MVRAGDGYRWLAISGVDIDHHHDNDHGNEHPGDLPC